MARKRRTTPSVLTEQSDHDTITTVNAKAKGSKMADDLVTTMQFQDDIASAEAPPMLVAKEYPMTITKSRFDTVGDAGVFLMADLVIQPKDYPADFAGAEDNPEGVVITRILLAEVQDGQGRQTRKHAWNMKRVYQYCGVKPPKDNTVDTSQFDGKEVLGKLGYREANGDTFYKVTGIHKREED